MSGFKRMQSKVFWGQMAAQDLDRSPLLSGAAIASAVGGLDPMISHVYCNPAMHGDNGEESIRGNDGSDGNATAVRVDRVIDDESNVNEDEASQRKRVRSEIEDRSSDNPRIQGARDGIAIETRSRPIVDEKSSPSACNRSLDSGFSDSDRSNSPDIYDNGTPGRPRRRAKIFPRDRSQISERMHHRLGSLWRTNDVLPDPAHTSTPKAQRHPTRCRPSSYVPSETVGRRSTLVPTFTRPQRFDEDGEKNSVIHASGSIEEECIGDFLYANEPPEDDDVPAITSVSSIASANDRSNRGTRRRESSSKFIAEKENVERRTAVRAWLANLVVETDDECCITLQSKSLPRRNFIETINEKSQTRDLRILTGSATAAATELLVRADGFTRHLRQVVEKVSELDTGLFGAQEVIRSIEEEAFSILAELGAPPARRIQRNNLRRIVSELQTLGNLVDDAINTRLDFYIERVVRGLEESSSSDGRTTRGALAALTALGLAGTRAGNSIARCMGIRVLLTSLISARRLSSDLRGSTLRALASVCCCPAAIEQFVHDDGPEILLDVLASETTPEMEKMEAAALVVQLTAPWTNALGLVHLEAFADNLVDYLTQLAERASCGQTILLAAAGLNNLADSRKFVRPMLSLQTVKRLLKSVKKLAGGNVWLMEQVASLIGKLAKLPEARCNLASARASVALVCFLRMRPPGLEDAYRRLEVTAAEALTRLCVDPEIARQVVAVGGTDCLPSYGHRNSEISDNEQQPGLLKYTKSLRRACKRAAREIDVARAHDDYTVSD